MGRKPAPTHPGTFRAFLLFAATLAAATVALGLSDARYEVIRTIPVEHAEPASPARADRRDASAGKGTRKERSSGTWHVARLPARGEQRQWLRLSTALGGELYALGPDATRPPVLATWFTRPNGARQNVSPTPLASGMQNGRLHREIRFWPDRATEVVAAVMPRASRGELTLRRFEVEAVALSVPYRLSLLALVGGWAVLAAGAVRYVAARSGGPAALVPIALTVLIGAAVMFSGNVIENVVRPIVSLAHGTRAGVSLVATFKIGHAVAFALLTVSLLMVRRRFELTVPRVLALLAVLAVASEAAQLHLPSRTPQLLDLLIDASGVAIGLLAWWAGTILLARRASRGEPSGPRSPSLPSPSRPGGG